MLGSLMVVGCLAVVLAAGAVLLALQNSRLKVELQEARRAWSSLRDMSAKLEAALHAANEERMRLGVAQQDATAVRQELAATQARLTSVLAESKGKDEWLDHQEKAVEWYKQELATRPKTSRRTYRILTVGVSGTGKTSLTLKWASPLVDLGKMAGTKVERYERTVSRVPDGDEMVEHVFEVRDFGGEYIVEAQEALIVDEVHGLLFVVDLTAREGTTIDPARIQQQISEFRFESLRFFLGSKIMATCQSVVLFINKSDMLSGTPAEIEREARRHYQSLIDALQKFKLDVQVFVGSATYGHSTHHLFAHFVSRVLPESAYDPQLLQRLKADALAVNEARPALAEAAPKAAGEAPVIRTAAQPIPAAQTAKPAAPPRRPNAAPPPLPGASPAIVDARRP